MELKPEEIEKLKKLFLEKTGLNGGMCNLCGHKEWLLEKSTFELRPFNKGNLLIGGVSLMPIIPFICKNCGHVEFINPIILGIDYDSEK